MKLLRRQFERIAPLFEKGGRLHKLHPLFEAGFSFLFTPAERTGSGPHVRDGLDLKRMMTVVVVALLPCTLFGMFNSGYQELRGLDPTLTLGTVNLLSAFVRGLWHFLPLYAVTLAVGGLFETLFAIVRKHEINEGFFVTSLLFPLVLGPSVPLWQAALGIAFGVVIGKEVFGGTGMNILNPALVARLFLYIAYPAQLSGDAVWVAGHGAWADGFSGATPLAQFAVPGAAATTFGWLECFLGLIPGSIGETSVVCVLLGAAVLILTKIGSWRVMLGCLAGLVGTCALLNLLAPSREHYMAVPAHWHLVVGGFAFGAVFMATDPVSAAQTDLGRWIYGILIGALTVVVRVLNPAYPEGIMLAILFMNVFAPTIDYYVVKANIKRREARLAIH